MPYKTVDELPDAVKNLPTPELKEAWMKAYNAAHAQYEGDESKAAATAWSVIGKMGYVKKGDDWVKAEYVKDLGLKPGEYLHPNEEGEKLVITEQNIKDYVSNTQKVLDSGGSIPITISHPETERDKIELNEGEVVGFWYDTVEQTPYMAFNPSPLVKGWIDSGKLKAVSPGIYYDVITSIGKLPSLIDHVALTNSPFNIQQSGFMPITAEKFGRAVLFFENKYISHNQGGGLLEMVRALYEKVIGKSDTSPQGGNKMELEQAKKTILELEAQNKKDKDEIAARDKTVLDQQGKIEKYEKEEKARLDLARNTAVASATARVDKLIEEKKVEPKNRDGLLKDFTTLYDNKIEDAERLMFSRFDAAKSVENEIKQDQVIVEKENIDLNTSEGQDKLHKVIMTRAKELAKADGKKTANQYFEQARDEVCAENDIDPEKL